MCGALLKDTVADTKGKTKKRGTISEVAHKWADWLCHPCRLEGAQLFSAGDKMSSGPQVGGLATSPMPSGGAQRLNAGDKIKSGLQVAGLGTSRLACEGTSGGIGYVTPAPWGVPKALVRGTKSKVAHKWANWLRHPYNQGCTQHFSAGNTIRGGLCSKSAHL